jgi:hypothetical protein
VRRGEERRIGEMIYQPSGGGRSERVQKKDLGFLFENQKLQFSI